MFVQVVDPVGTGYVASLARPGGNVTGFTPFEYALTGKWLELLKEIVPDMTRAAVLREAGGAGIGQWAVLQAAAASPAMELSPINVRRAGEDRACRGDASPAANSGLIVVVSAWATVHRELIIALAAKHRLPAIYPYRYFVAGGGLVSYGPDLIDQYRRAAGYVDRILKGEKPADLPVQAPTKYELIINLKTAKALGLDHSTIAARPRRRGDRMSNCVVGSGRFAARHRLPAVRVRNQPSLCRRRRSTIWLSI